MSVDNYLVFYIPEAPTQTVSVIRVMYGGTEMEESISSQAWLEGIV